jgi:rhodanese-related sulfurtransferase
VLYCGGGFRSALAADNLRAMGYTRAISMDGGYTGWKQAGYKVEVDD